MKFNPEEIDLSEIEPSLAGQILTIARSDAYAQLTPVVSELAANGKVKSASSLGLFLLNRGVTDQQLFNVLGFLAHHEGAPFEAAHHFLAAYLGDGATSAGRNLLHLLESAGLYAQAVRFAELLSKEIPQTDSDFTSLVERCRSRATVGNYSDFVDWHARHSRKQDIASPWRVSKGSKSMFLVSYTPHAWIPGMQNLFIAEPCVHHLLEKQGRLAEFKSVVIGSPVRSTKEDLLRDNQFVEMKYSKYLPILAARLNSVHSVNKSVAFWKKCFSMALYRQITILYDFFRMCEERFNPDEHTCRVLGPSGYHFPLDFDEQRWFIQTQHYGQEQLLSHYMELFYPLGREPFVDQYRYKYRISAAGCAYETQPTVGIMRTVFSEDYTEQLIGASGGAINRVGFDRNFDVYQNHINGPAREFLAKIDFPSDRFDLFFFSTLRYLMPRVFVESFAVVKKYIESQLARYTKLTHVVSEVWLSETYEAIGLAILQERGVRHVHSEHNAIEHHFYSSKYRQEADLCDVFLAHGNYKAPAPNVVSSGSLFQFRSKQSGHPKQRKLLYISSICFAKYNNFSHIYTETAENVVHYHRFKKTFFESLSTRAKSELVYRGYPKDDYARMWDFVYDESFVMREHLVGVKMADLTQPCKDMIMESELVVIDYAVTSFLESLSMNIPTVVFVRPESFHLNSEHAGFYDSLFQVGIAQRDPVQAAHFVDSVLDNPQRWWSSDSVQRAREAFIDLNVGKPENAMAFYLELAGIKAAL